MENEIENEGGITVGYIFRTIFSQKWLALIIAAVITVAGTLGLYFSGKKDETYSVSFVLQLPKTVDATTTTYTYPDGESFYFTDLISYDNLKEVADKSVDVDKMVKNNDISITRAVDKLDNSTSGVYDLNYTLKVKAKYFSGDDAARRFIKAITEMPGRHIAGMQINFDYYFTSSKSAVTFERQLNELEKQTVYIQSKYTEYIDRYGGDFPVADGRTLANFKAEIDSYLSADLSGSNIFTALKANVNKNGYIKSGAEEKLQYDAELDFVEQQLKEAEASLNRLTDSVAASSSVIIDGEIVKLCEKIGNLTVRREQLNRYIDFYKNGGAVSAEFTGELAKVEAAVEKFTTDIQPVAKNVYGKVTKVNYLSSKVVEVKGGRGLVKSLIISLAAGIVAAAIVSFAVGYSKEKKAKVVAGADKSAEEGTNNDK